jgi:flavin-dependent dehydrogenase
LIGEAARLVNLFTGEGIPYALESGRAAARALMAARADSIPVERGVGGTPPRRLHEGLERSLRRSLGASLFSGHLLCSFGHPLLNTVGYLAGLKTVKRAISSAFS